MPRIRKRKRAVRRPRRIRKPRRARVAPVGAIEATLAGLAHDIRTPLTGILALGELLAASELGERERQWAAAIKSNAEHLSALASLIVDAARAEAKGLMLRPTVFAPRELAESMGVSLAARARAKEIESGVAIADHLPERALADVVRLRSAVENLIDNAVKFTHRGKVRLEVTSARAARAHFRLTFSVADSGIGLSTAEIKKLFRPFAQAHEDIARRYGGAGLGLVSVRRIAKAMGGNLTVAGRPGGGSVFKLTVTVDAAKEDAAVEATRGRAPSATRKLKILCVEDNPFGRILLNTILTELGHRSDFVSTGEAAVTAAGRGSYDLVLMDITLPGISGIEATRRIRALDGARAQVPIIGISGRATSGDEAVAREAGMTSYVVKPLSPSGVSQLIALIGDA
jgi:CheY-like chemotaxis protein/nitrogen-specific signal transduction histidine kinase